MRKPKVRKTAPSTSDRKSKSKQPGDGAIRNHAALSNDGTGRAPAGYPASNGHPGAPDAGRDNEVAAKIKELVRLAQEQGYLTYGDINEALPENLVTPEDLDEIYIKLRNLEVEIVDQAEVDRVKQPEPEEEEDKVAAGHSGRSGPHVSQADGPGAAA